MRDTALWRIKLHARLHDPAEKALVLLRDPAGHEGGTSRVLRRMADEIESAAELLENDDADVLHAVLFDQGIDADSERIVKRADWWAAAADRPQWPLREVDIQSRTGAAKTLAVADFAQVRWSKQPQLIHPLTGQVFDLGKQGGLADTDFQDIKQRSFEHFSRLLVRQNGATDFKKTLLAFWRFGPEVGEEDDFGKLGALWRLLPADTRIPDHSIWDHLDLTSAFAGAFAADPNGEVALLSVSIGPVQSFIEAARSTSDLWAGSHLLARLAWETMKPICDALGPDAILFPQLRGSPQVDLWLRDECGLDPELFRNCDWGRGETDANPLFGAALPNRFVAIVPASQAASLARRAQDSVRAWLQKLGQTVVDRLIEAAQLGNGGEQHCHQQMREQLDGFPEVHWAAVPFSLIRCKDEIKQRDLDVTALSEAMRPFFGGEGEPGFLGSAAWRVLQKEMRWDDRTRFFAPNPGVLYPAVYELAERVLAAAKTTRRFSQMQQRGWRCSLTGETEWLAMDPAQLGWTQAERNARGTLWTKLAGRFGVKKGEHLGALPALKRVWPSLFAEEVGKALGRDIKRFVVSTHTMALAAALQDWAGKDTKLREDLITELERSERSALPRKLAKAAHRHPQGDLIARMPGWLDAARDTEEASELEHASQRLQRALGRKFSTYYALLLMDGDHMGRWLSGADDYAISYMESFHKQVQAGVREKAKGNVELQRYLEQRRALSPNRHLAISGALNDFSLTVARHVIEEEHAGRLIYSGGDDVLAMLPVPDLLSAMQRLRCAYAGHDPACNGTSGLKLEGGFALLDGRVIRLMGEKATASIGAVIAHHQAPLGAVLRELRAAEQRAKKDGERDAFSIVVVKRGGGTLYLTDKWHRGDGQPSPMIALRELSEAFKGDEASRRAAYLTSQWAADLPEVAQFHDEAAYREMLQKLLHYQFGRQGLERKQQPVHALRLARLVPVGSVRETTRYLDNFLAVAEFLAREAQS